MSFDIICYFVGKEFYIGKALRFQTKMSFDIICYHNRKERQKNIEHVSNQDEL